MSEVKIIVDGHCDTLSKSYDEHLNLDNKKYAFNISQVEKQLPYLQFLASFINTKFLISKDSGYKRVKEMLNKYDREVKRYSNVITIKKASDIDKVIEENKLGILLTVENGSAISGDINNVKMLYKRGIRVMSLTWNYDNDLACGTLTKKDLGLSVLGMDVIRYMNQMKMILDVSHLSYKSFYDVIDITSRPIVATHSCVRSLCNTPRNLTDDQIKEIAKLDGVVGICFCSEFLRQEKEASSDDIVRHIEYVIHLVGIDHVGLGTDFDGLEKSQYPNDIKGVKDITILLDKLNKRGFTKADLDKIAGGNWIRVLKQVMT